MASRNISREEDLFRKYNAHSAMATKDYREELYSGNFTKKLQTTENKIHILILRQPTATRFMTLLQQVSQKLYFHERHVILVVFDGCCGDQCESEAKEILYLLWLRYRYSRTSIMQGQCNGKLLLNIHTFHPYLRLYNRDSWQWGDDELFPIESNSFQTIYIDKTDNLYGNQISTEIRLDLDTSYFITSAANNNWSEDATDKFRLSGANIYFLVTLANKLNASLELEVPLWFLMPDIDFNHFARKFIRRSYHPIKVHDWIFKNEATLLNITCEDKGIVDRPIIS